MAETTSLFMLGREHLGNIDLGPFGSSDDHGLEVVVLGKRALCRCARLVASVVENSIHHVLKRLTQRIAGSRFKLVVVSPAIQDERARLDDDGEERERARGGE